LIDLAAQTLSVPAGRAEWVSEQRAQPKAYDMLDDLQGFLM
jgi:hypothetical protein